ncbi:S8 family serine peptidase [Streptomyces sp. NPDC093675]|uniref:S8 family serine peptidase n=1 Tax=Streptomyces sp. NPDC093675 TaxID=3366049 RepID=UPI0037F1A476
MHTHHAIRPSRSRHGALALCIGLLALTGSPPTPASADEGSVVRLPAIPTRLSDSAQCTQGSDRVVSAAPWERGQLDLDRASRFSDGSGVTVGVVDTGVSTVAPSLRGRLTVVGPAGDDCVGHGTFVAGLIGAAPAPHAGFSGVAPKARVVGLTGTDSQGRPDVDLAAQAIRAGVDSGARVLDVSLGFDAPSDALQSAVSYAHSHDVLIVAAAAPDTVDGNEDATPHDYWPAVDDGVLSVQGLDQKGQPVDSFSPRRSDLAAPGEGVVSVGPSGEGNFIGTGNSLAAAYVAGTAALVRSSYPRLTSDQVARKLVLHAYPAAVPVLDPYAAVSAVSDPVPSPARPDLPAQSQPVRFPDTASADRAEHRSLLVGASSIALVAAVAWTTLVLPRGRKRQWRGALSPTHEGSSAAAPLVPGASRPDKAARHGL